MKDIKAAQAAREAAKIKGYATGGAVKGDTSDASSGMARGYARGGGIAMPMDGMPAKSRMDRKGKSSKGGHTSVNVIIAGKGDTAPAGPPVMPMPQLAMVKPPMPPMPPAAGPGGPMPPPGLMPRKDGGRVGMKAGIGSGVGRMELSKIEGKGK